MKKATLSTVVALLSDLDFDNKEELMNELYTDLNRGAEEKAAKAAEYEAAHDAVIEAIRVAGVPVSVADIFAEAKNSLPDGFTKNKVSYGLRNYWKDEVMVESGKVNLYSLKEGA